MAADKAGKPKHVADIHGYDIDMLDPDPDNNRDVTSPAALALIDAQITERLLATGFDAGQELLVRPTGNGRAMVTDGHRRRIGFARAVDRGMENRIVPCRHEDRATDALKRVLIRLRPQGVERSPMEVLPDIQRLIGWQWSDARIAKALGRPVSWVRDTITIASGPEQIAEAVKEDTIGRTAAARLIREAETAAAAVATFKGATDAAAREARAKGREPAEAKVRARHVEEVTRPAAPRTEPASVHSLAREVVRASHEIGPKVMEGLPAEFVDALAALGARFPELTREAA